MCVQLLALQEFIAVSQLNKSVQGKILCFTGPPGKRVLLDSSWVSVSLDPWVRMIQ